MRWTVCCFLNRSTLLCCDANLTPLGFFCNFFAIFLHFVFKLKSLSVIDDFFFTLCCACNFIQPGFVVLACMLLSIYHHIFAVKTTIACLLCVYHQPTHKPIFVASGAPQQRSYQPPTSYTAPPTSYTAPPQPQQQRSSSTSSQGYQRRFYTHFSPDKKTVVCPGLIIFL